MIFGTVQNQGHVMANGSQLKNVDSFTYLGSCPEGSANAMTDVNIRIGKELEFPRNFVTSGKVDIWAKA